MKLSSPVALTALMAKPIPAVNAKWKLTTDHLSLHYNIVKLRNKKLQLLKGRILKIWLI